MIPTSLSELPSKHGNAEYFAVLRILRMISRQNQAQTTKTPVLDPKEDEESGRNCQNYCPFVSRSLFRHFKPGLVGQFWQTPQV
jgi:hypothetical protein